MRVAILSLIFGVIVLFYVAVGMNDDDDEYTERCLVWAGSDYEEICDSEGNPEP